MTTFLRRNWDILLIVSAGLAVRLTWLAMARPMPISDWHFYRVLAFDILDHGQLGYPDRTTFYLPGQPAYLAVWAFFSRSDVWLGVGMIAVATASIVLVFLVGKKVFAQRGPALLAAGLFALIPHFVAFSPVLATEHVFVLLMLSAMAMLLHRDPERGLWLAGGAGLALGAAMLTRGEGVFYVPALVFFIWAGSRAVARRASLQATVVLLVAAAVVVVPWYIRNSTVTDPSTGLSTGAGINFYFAHNDSGTYGWYPQGTPFDGLPNDEASDLGWRLAFEYLAENPLRLFGDSLFGTYQLFRTPEYALFWSTHHVPEGDPNDPALFTERDIFGLRTAGVAVQAASAALIVLGAAALLAWRSWSRPMATLLVPLVASTWVLRTVIYWAKPRYRYFLDVVLVFFAAFVVWLLLRAWRSQPTGRDPAKLATRSREGR